MKKFLVLLATFSVVTACGSDDAEITSASAETADLILTNARVYTLRWGDPTPDGESADDAPRTEAG
ncbi:MAG: hypothetical protein AAGA33_14855, partial [Pseudomonadota bacterium]